MHAQKPTFQPHGAKFVSLFCERLRDGSVEQQVLWSFGGKNYFKKTASGYEDCMKGEFESVKSNSGARCLGAKG